MARTPKEQWYYCGKIDEIGSYWVLPDGQTTFERGLFMAYGDSLATGFDSREEAEQWRAKFGPQED